MSQPEAGGERSNRPPHGGNFSVMVKPAGSTCNLDCLYCYYKDKNRLYPGTRRFRMSDRLLEAFIRDYIAAQEGPNIQFCWQGGEPTLLGVDFFRKVVALQARHCPAGTTVSNALQTNGTLLNARWAGFLREHDFLVGLSIDGPRRFHDRYRVDRKGGPSHDAVLGALRLLRDEGVEFNTLTVVHRDNALHGRRIYRFLRDEGVRFMQFIPLVERVEGDDSLAGAPPEGEAPAAAVAAWSVPPQAYGTFMRAVFDDWVRNDVGHVYVQLFDVELGLWTGRPSELCVFAETCGMGLALEHNGDLYVCDHYVYPEHRLGNILERPLGALAHSSRQQRFGQDKRERLPRYCRDCDYLFVCNGGCPKHRFARSPDGEPGLNYLCPSYKRYFSHTAPYMRIMSELLRAGRPPALVSGMLHGRKSKGPARIKRGTR
jgi:uncharacterized protein